MWPGAHGQTATKGRATGYARAQEARMPGKLGGQRGGNNNKWGTRATGLLRKTSSKPSGAAKGRQAEGEVAGPHCQLG